jgi:hypothetical protein
MGPLPIRLTFPPGEAHATAYVETIADDLEEGTEYVVISFESSDPKVRTPASLTLTMKDPLLATEQVFWICCEGPSGRSIQRPGGIEGATVELLIQSGHVERFRYWTTDQTALAGIDYVLPQQIGTNDVPIQIELLDNRLAEGKKTFLIHFEPVDEFQLGPTNTFTFTIYDDEVPNSIDTVFQVPSPFTPDYLGERSTVVLPLSDGSLLLYANGHIMEFAPTGSLLNTTRIAAPSVGISAFQSDGRLIAAE